MALIHEESHLPPLHGQLLYIEDSEVSCFRVKALLAHHIGLPLMHAGTGIEGVRMPCTEPPDFVHAGHAST